MLLWLAEALGLQDYRPNPWRKANAIALMKTAKEGMQATGTPWRFGNSGTNADELKEFAQTYAGIIADGNPPVKTCYFPGVVPRTETRTAGNKQIRDRALKRAYEAHMIQYNAIAEWVQKERELTRWFKKMEQNKKARKDHSSYKSIKWSGWVGRFDTPQVLTKDKRPPSLCRQCTAVVFLGLTNTCCNRNGLYSY